MGHIVEGVWPHPDKIKAIAEIPEPNYKNQAELCYFLGMVNYYDCFVPAGLATTCTCAPLNSIYVVCYRRTHSEIGQVNMFSQ